MSQSMFIVALDIMIKWEEVREKEPLNWEKEGEIEKGKERLGKIKSKTRARLIQKIRWLFSLSYQTSFYTCFITK